MEETKRFLDNLEFFLLYDDDARWKAILWIIVLVGSAGSIDLVALDSSVDDATVSMGIFALILSIGWIAWYCSFRPNRNIETSPSRRALILQVTAGLAGLFIGVFLWRIQARTLNLDLAKAAKGNDYRDAAYVFERAKDANIHLDKNLVRRVGHKFVEASDRSATAWDASLALVNYRSFLNANTHPTLGQLTVPPADAAYKISLHTDASTAAAMQGANTLRWKPGQKSPVQPGDKSVLFQLLYAGGPASPADSARLEDLRDPQTSSSGTKFFVIDGGVNRLNIGLDYEYMKNVVIRNANVQYLGGPVRLQNVFFINCTFEMKAVGNSQNLALAVLEADPSTNFSGD